MHPRVGQVPRRWKVWAETTAARLAARAAEDSLKATMIAPYWGETSGTGCSTLMKKWTKLEAVRLFIDSRSALSSPGRAARHRARSSRLATAIAPNARGRGVQNNTTAQPHRQPGGTSFLQSNERLGVQNRVRGCGHRMGCFVSDLPLWGPEPSSSHSLRMSSFLGAMPAKTPVRPCRPAKHRSPEA